LCYQTLAAALYNLININAEVQKFFNSDLDVEADLSLASSISSFSIFVTSFSCMS